MGIVKVKEVLKEEKDNIIKAYYEAITLTLKDQEDYYICYDFKHNKVLVLNKSIPFDNELVIGETFYDNYKKLAIIYKSALSPIRVSKVRKNISNRMRKELEKVFKYNLEHLAYDYSVDEMGYWDNIEALGWITTLEKYLDYTGMKKDIFVKEGYKLESLVGLQL